MAKSRQARWDEEAAKLRKPYDELVAMVNEYKADAEAKAAEAAEALADEFQTLFDALQDKAGPLISQITDSFAALKEIQDEFDDWGEQKNEATKDKLDALQGLTLELDVEINTNHDISIDVTVELSDIEDAVDEAESAELPQGFGRD